MQTRTPADASGSQPRPPALTIAHRRVLRAVGLGAGASRLELARSLDIRPNTVGVLVAELIGAGLLAEGDRRIAGPGRPQRLLRIHPDDRRVLGLAIEPGRVACSAMNLLGRPIDPPQRASVSRPSGLVRAAADLLRRQLDAGVVCVGVSTTGFVDPRPEHPRLLLSSALPRQSSASLTPIFAAAAATPVVLDNDMHALAAAWLVTHPESARDDLLLVELRDGAIGGALVIDGKPNRGCVLGGNEIGHTRCGVRTRRCYCGQIGCLERLFSSAQLGTRPGRSDDLAARLATGKADQHLSVILDQLGWGLANAVNLIRPARLVLHATMPVHPRHGRRLDRAVRDRLLGPLAERVAIERWTDAPARFSQSACFLALRWLFGR